MRAASPLSVFRLRAVRSVTSLVATCVMIANCGGGKDATSAPVTPTVSAVAITGIPAESVLTTGSSVQLAATAKDAAGATLGDKPVTWTSASKAVATVSSAGLVTALSTGFTTITASSEGKSADFALAVRAAVALPPAGSTQPATSTALNGTVTITVPPGATTTPLNIGPADPAGFPATAEIIPGTAVTFGPANATLAKPINVTIDVDTTGLTADDLENLGVYTLQAGQWVEVPSFKGIAPANARLFGWPWWWPLVLKGTYSIQKPHPATTIQVASGDAQTANVGAALSISPSVKLTDNKGAVTSKATVYLKVSDGGTLSATRPVKSDINGIASLGKWTLGPTAGPQTVTASLDPTPRAGTRTVTITATATPVPSPGIGLSRSSAAFSYAAGTAPLPAAQTIDITNSGIGKLTGLTLGTTVYGDGATGWLSASISGNTAPATLTLAVAPGLTRAGSYTATVPVTSPVAGDSPRNVTVTMTVTGMAASKLAIATQPASPQSGLPLAPQPVIEIRNDSGSKVQLPDFDVTAAIASGTGVLRGTTTVRSVAGVATFSDLVLTGAGPLTLTFSAPGLPSVTSGTISFPTAQPLIALAIVGQPTTAESGVAMPAVSVELQAVSGGSTAGFTNAVTASIASGTGTLSGTTTVNAVDGLARFSNLRIAGTGAHTLTFTSTGLTSATSGAISLSQVVRQLAVTTQPGGAANGIAFTTQPVVALRDAAGLSVPAATNAVTASIATGTGTLSGTTTINAVNGVASFTDLKVTGSGAITLAFTSPGATSATSASFNLPAAPPAKLAVITQPSASVESGVPFATQPVVEVRDNADGKVLGATTQVSALLLSGTGTLSGTTTVNAVNGVATFTNLKISGAGPHTLGFNASGLTSTSSASVSVTQVVRTVSIVGQPSGAFTGIPFTSQPVVLLLDAAGLAVSSASNPVTAVVASGTGILAGTTTINATGGIASFTDLKITGTGPHTLRFDVAGATSATSAAFTVTTAVPTQVAIVTQPSGTSESGVALATQPVIEIRDGANAKVSVATNSVTVSLASGSGSLSGTTTVAAVNGLATFTNLVISGSGSHTLQFTATGLTPATSGPIVVSQVVRQVTITTQPAGAVSGVAFTTQPVVRLKDAAGLNINSTQSVSVSSTGPGVLSGTLSVAAVNGVAPFTNLAITGTGSHTLTFTTAGATPATSASFAVAGSPATQLAISTAPSAAVESGVIFPVQPVVQVRDALGNLVTTSGASVTALLASGTGTISGTITRAAVNGVATFTDLKISGAGNHTIIFSSTGLGSVTTTPISVVQTPGAISVNTQPAGAADGVAFTTQPVIRIVDKAGLLIDDSNLQVTASKLSGPGTLGGTTTVSAVNGIATFTNLAITGAGTHVLSFVLTATPSIATNSNDINVTSGPPGITAAVGNSPTQSISIAAGNVTIPVNLDLSNRGSDDLASITVIFSWDPQKFTYVSNSAGSWTDSQGGSASVFVNTTDAANGNISISGFTNNATLVSQVLRNVTLTPLAQGPTSIMAIVTAAGNASGMAISVMQRPLAAMLVP